ncbi:MAG TPA: DUF2127 domain-containing protein [Opitutaceae bacterium]|jgi:uncharacterized membrane protein (DUF2068 family)
MDKKAPLGLKLIAGAKIAKGVAFALLSLGVFDMIHKDLGREALHVVQVLRISPENHYVELALEKLGLVEPRTLIHLGELTALFATTELIEGLGLWFGMIWAEYVVVVSTGLFIPKEWLEVIRRPSPLHATVLFINFIIFVYVVYLVWERYLRRAAARSAGPPAPN